MKTKKQFINRILSLVLTFVIVLGMMPMSSLTAHAAEAGVNYIAMSWNASSKTVASTTKNVQATTVTANDSSWGQDGKTTYYVVNTAVTSTQSEINVYGEVHLILNQKFSVAGRIRVQENGMAGICPQYHLWSVLQGRGDCEGNPRQ